MPKTPKGGKRPTDVIGNAIHVMRIATGEIADDTPADDGKDQAAVALGKKGGAARAEAVPRGALGNCQESSGFAVEA